MSPKVMLFLWITLVLISPSSERPQCCNWLVQTWPVGYGYARGDWRRLSNFTIHGLWPRDSNGNGLDVHFGRHMNRDDICEVIQGHPQTDLLSAGMVTYWPSLIFQYNVHLWRNEWNTHGRYQNSLEPAAYFMETIRLVKDINLKDMLEEEGIVPSNRHKYLIESYIRAIKKYTQERPLLLCNPILYEGFPVLSEVVFCVDEIANGFVSCTVPWSYRSLCPPLGQIWFLDSPP